jgi:succinyl-diaminopimelate desuccinylase
LSVSPAGDAERLERLALELVDIPSTSRHEEAITSWIAGRVGGIRHRQADALVFGRPGPVDVVLAGHSDTVPAQANLPGRLEGGMVHGLGAADMKASLAVMICLAQELSAGRAPALNPLFVIFGREELPLSESVLAGLFDACPAIEEARLVLMMEPTANTLQAGCLGNIKASLVFRGVSAHSARPWLGRNAIHEAVGHLQAVVGLSAQPVDLDGLTFKEVLSVTEIQGGIANNVIPDTVTCGLNYRYAGNRSAAQAEARLRELAGPAGELAVISNAAGAPAHLDNPLLQGLRRLGGLEVQPKQAWTPVAEFHQRGLQAVNFGPGDPELAHRRDERVAVQAMLDSLGLLRSFLAGSG